MRGAVLRWAFWVVITALLLTAVLFSPMAFVAVTSVRKADWTLLGDVGQAYGGVSALVSAVALVGVSVSLIVQARQATLARTQAMRSFHFDMLALSMQEPELYWPLLDGRTPGDPDAMRQRIFAVYLMNYVRTGFMTGAFSEESLRVEILPSFFRHPVSRTYWQEARGRGFSSAEPSFKGRRLLRIIDDEFEKALRAGPPIQLEAPHDRGVKAGNERTWLLAAGLVLLGGLGFAQRLLRRGR